MPSTIDELILHAADADTCGVWNLTQTKPHFDTILPNIATSMATRNFKAIIRPLQCRLKFHELWQTVGLNQIKSNVDLYSTLSKNLKCTGKVGYKTGA